MSNYKKMMGYSNKNNKSKTKPSNKNKIIEGIVKEQEQFKTSKQIQIEADLGDINLPSSVKRFMGRFVDGIKGANLNRMKRAAVLHHILTALGIKPNELSQYMSKVKRGL